MPTDHRFEDLDLREEPARDAKFEDDYLNVTAVCWTQRSCFKTCTC